MPGLAVGDDAAPSSRALHSAAAILSVHVQDPIDGSCVGCRSEWSRWIFHHDCPHANWAMRVTEEEVSGMAKNDPPKDNGGGRHDRKTDQDGHTRSTGPFVDPDKNSGGKHSGGKR